jgi:uracil-DNA glycosylase family protein
MPSNSNPRSKAAARLEGTRKGNAALEAAKRKARACRDCPLFKFATQTVFGEGPSRARIMLVGEQPGDHEDRVGRPFVGPAGKLLDEALKRAELPRDSVYLTNAVKHFKYVREGKRRLHAKPSESEVQACMPWLESEIKIVSPEIVVALGATSSKALAGNAFRVTGERGRILRNVPGIKQFMGTLHPSAILRGRPEDRERGVRLLASDLRKARRAAANS